jgi:hypothetical protein
MVTRICYAHLTDSEQYVDYFLNGTPGKGLPHGRPGEHTKPIR